MYWLLSRETCGSAVESCVSLSFRNTIRFPRHKDAVFLSAIAMPRSSDYLGFYRTRFDSYETGLAILNSRLQLVLELGVTIPKCEDPRSFVLKDEIYVVDNHMTEPRHWYNIHSMQTVTAKTSHPQQGKNWSPLIYNETLHFIFSLDPLCIIRCDVHTGNCIDLHDVCKEKAHGGEWRGGTNAIVLGSLIAGFGHRTMPGAHHEPFFWTFPISSLFIPNTTKVEMYPINDTFHRSYGWVHPSNLLGVHDPSALVMRRGELLLVMTESDTDWFREQTYNLTTYKVHLTRPCSATSPDVSAAKRRWA